MEPPPTLKLFRGIAATTSSNERSYLRSSEGSTRTWYCLLSPPQALTSAVPWTLLRAGLRVQSWKVLTSVRLIPFGMSR